MITIQNTYNSALVYAETLDSGAEGLIRALCGSPISKGSSIRIMPDVHAGKGCAVGTTMTIKDCVAPGLVGVDIGCGMLAVKFHAKRLELQKLDKLIHDKIPAGKQARSVPHHFADKADLDELLCLRHVQKDKALCAVGTLGGGNHFIEVDKAADGAYWLIIHAELEMPNIPTPTMGGHRFWTTLAEFNGYRLQQNQFTHHARILNANDVRIAWGTLNGMEKALDRLILFAQKYA